MNPMAGFCTKSLFLLLASLAIARLAMAGDPDILTDYIVPPGAPIIDGNFFTYNGVRPLINITEAPLTMTTIDITADQFPALNGQSVSYSIQLYPIGSANLHLHPRSAELLFLINGRLEVGFVDSNNKLFTQTLEAGDMFVFPKGLVHFESNPDPNFAAKAYSAYGSANPGSVSLPSTLFNTGINDDDLARSFNTDRTTIQKLKAGLQNYK